MKISDAMKVLDVSRTTMVQWLQDGKFPGAKRDKSVPTAPWYIPAEDVEAVRQERVAELEHEIQKIAVPVGQRKDIDLTPVENGS